MFPLPCSHLCKLSFYSILFNWTLWLCPLFLVGMLIDIGNLFLICTGGPYSLAQTMALWKSKQVSASHLGISEIFRMGALTESGVFSKYALLLLLSGVLAFWPHSSFTTLLAPGWMFLALLLTCLCSWCCSTTWNSFPLFGKGIWYRIKFFALKLDRNGLDTGSVSY